MHASAWRLATLLGRSKCHAVDGPPSKRVPSDRPAADGPTLGKVFSKSVEPEKWTRKDEAVSAVSLTLSFKAS